jgi:hypothetical protein
MLLLGAAAALAGCNSENHTIIAGGPDNGDNGDNSAEANTPVALPPSVTASKIYRCADNKIVYVDWLSDDKSANVRTEPGPGKPMTAAGGYEVSGTSGASTAKIAVPGHAAQSCKA